ncbi:DEAD/DEAH box helicase family protein [Vibrio parahaemolyticus]|nr:DEAD/DEAH box helicase family protein [Vibrio parahaemolyticus]EHU5159169.1 DEAD/DEAH box helicase family protein [Vibrio parahaemolyticus]
MDIPYFTFELVKPVVTAIESLHEASKSHIKTMNNDPKNIEDAKRFREVLSSQKAELKKSKKALGKPPRLSRSKKPAKRVQNNTDRDAYFEKKAKLDDEINILNERQKQLSFSPFFNDSVTSFSEALDAMCFADYQVGNDGSLYIPNYHDVYDRLVFACEHCASIKTDQYDDWNKAVEEAALNIYSEELIKIALAYLAASKRAHQYPHNISQEQVYDGFGEEPWGEQLTTHIRDHFLIPKQQEAIKCTRLSTDACIYIEHVSALMDAVTPSIRGASQVNNFYLSAPMGGVYNSEVNGQIHNSGSKTDGVLLPAIRAGLKHGHNITIVVHRITLTHDIYKRVETYINENLPKLKNKIWHYETRVAFNNPHVLVVCVNSITRPDIVEFVSNSKVVIVDEFTQVLDNITKLLEGDGLETTVQKAQATFDLLAEKIADYQTTFIALDADMESKTIKLISKHTNAESETMVFNIIHPECKLPLIQRRKQAVFHRDKKNTAQIKSLLQRWIDERNEAYKKATNNGRFFVAVDNKNQSVALAEYCKQEGLSVCLINSDTTQAKDNFGAYGLMRHTCEPENFDVVIFSPSITSGVSWTTPHFTKGIVIANKTIASGNLKQMLFRFRYTTLVHVFAQMTPARELVPENPSKKVLVEALAKSAKYGQAYLEIREHRREVEFQSTKNQRCYLAYQLAAEGWGYSNFDPSCQSDIETNKYRPINPTVRTDAIMDSPTLTMQQYKYITDRRKQTNKIEDIYAAIRFQSALYGAVSDVSEDVRLWVSGAADTVTGVIQMNLLAKEKSLTLQLLDTCLSHCGFPSWQQRLVCGGDISVPSSECLKFLLSCLEDPLAVNALHALGIFDGGMESNRKRWIRTNGDPVKETAVVISHAKVMYSASGNLLTDLSKKLTPPYKAIQLFDGNVLVINTEPKNSAFGGAMLRKLLAQCGIPAQSSDRATLIDGKKACSLINMAKRRSISHNIATQLAETSEAIRSVRLKCCADAVGFDVKIYAKGEVRIVATPDVIMHVTNQEKLARSESVVSFEDSWGSESALPHFKLGCSGNGDSNWIEVHLTPEKHQIEQSKTIYIKFPLSIMDYVRLILPSLLVNSAIVESMFHNLDLEVITGI